MESDPRVMLAAMRKVELHRHLEGSVRPATLLEICRERRIELPVCDTHDVGEMLCLRAPAPNLEGFLVPFRTIKFCFADREAIARITYEAVEDAASDNIEYVELRFSPEYMAFYHRLPLTDVMNGIVEGVSLAGSRFSTTAKLIVSISRNLSAETMAMPWPTTAEIVQLALDYADRGVVGMDLSGLEADYPAQDFAEPFRVAREAGLGVTVHAGEDDGPHSVREAIEHLGARRIGHGVRIIHDPEVMRLARDEGVVLEICPTSNVLTGAVPSHEEHPIRRLYDFGIPITVNTDDPTVCGVTLTDEYALIADKHGFTYDEITGLVETARRVAFA